MRLQEHIDFTTLQWVKPELDETLARAREALESFVEDPGRAAPMRECVDCLHQVQGTLRMVELYGAAMVAEEMETLAIALLEDHVRQREDAYAALMRGLMQLPDYLERLSSGHRDVPVVLLPLLNELRASRDQQALGESALFMPNLEAALPAAVPGVADAAAAAAHRGGIADLRLRFQQHLLAWFRGQNPDQQLAGMRQTLLAISARCWSVPGRRLWWIAAGVLEGLEQGLLKNQATEVRQLVGKVDRNIRQLLEQGEESLRGGDADELARKLLYIVAQAKQHSPQMDLLRQTYRLDSLLPDEGELEHARGSMSGHNRALLDSVSKALKEDLLRVKDALDLFLRQQGADPASLASQSDVLERIGDTLGMLALAVPRRVINEQRRVLEEIAGGSRPAQEETLLDVAGALLYVEASLDDHIERLGAEQDELPARGDSDIAPALPRSEARHILATLMQEAIGNTGKAKEAIVAFVESGWQHGTLASVPALMSDVAGALRMLTAARPAELAEGIGLFVGNELLADRRVPGSQQMDHLADALAALEYYLEAAREHRGGLEHVLDVAEHSLGALGYWPLPEARPVPAEADDDHAVAPAEPAAVEAELTEPVSVASGADLGSLIVGDSAQAAEHALDLEGLRLAQTEPAAALAPAPDADDGDWTEIEEEVLEEAPAADPLAASAGFQLGSDGIDDDIREIFLEEMQEEIANLQGAEQKWLADPAEFASLTPIRRSFHTLKGSGRLVGAAVLGEFAWKVENMLNRVLDQTIPPHEGVQALVHHAIAALPHLYAALRDGSAPAAPLSAIMQAADRLAAGDEHATVEQFAGTATQTVRKVVRRRVPRVDAAAVEAVPTAAHTDQNAVSEPAAAAEAIAMPAMPPVDPVLLEILRSEVAQYLQTIRAFLVRGEGELPVDDGLLRAVHTLHGAIAMVDIELLIRLLSPLESLLKRLRAAGEPLSLEGIGLLSRAADAVEQVMAQFDVPDPQLPDIEPLAARLAEMRDARPEPQVAHVLFEPQGLVEEHADDAEAAPAPVEEAAPAPAAAAPAEEPDEHDEFAAQLMAALDSFDVNTAVPLDASAHADDAEEVSLADSVPLDVLPADLLGEHAEAHADVERADTAATAPEAHEAAFVDALPVVGTDLAENGEAAVTSPEASGEAASPVEALADVHADEADAQHVGEGIAVAEAPDAAAAGTSAAGEDADASEAEVEAVEVAPVEEPVPVEALASAEPADQIEHVEAVPVAAPAAPDDAAEPAPPPAEAAATPAAPADAGWSSQLDPDLLEVFVEEAREILDHADGELAAWRAEPSNLAHVAELQRDLHTLKGGARIAGLVPVGDLTHAIEALLERPIAPGQDAAVQVIRALEGGVDRLHALVQRISQGQPVEYPQDQVDRFVALAGGHVSLEYGDEAPAPAESAPEPASRSASESTASAPEPFAEAEEDARAPQQQEQIRVRAELLDSLVNHAGEVAIYRSRLEQQVSAYRFNLVELEQTVLRLRSQLRMLEIETEAQIIARYQREHPDAGLGTFDPLELDRFSQLQQYSRALAESVSDLVSIQNMLDELTRQAETLLIQQSRVSADLQEGLLRTRMLPFDSMVPNLRRTLRQAAQEEGKHAQLFVEGAHGEMDRNLLDRIKAPFEHMLRNAIAHGIESPEARRKAGKPEEGAVRIRVAREATEVVVRVSDDGRGLDREAIRRRGVERGLIRADAKLTDEQVLGLITQSGFSTASTVTQLAGRGVGMDVVANEIKQLGGSLATESQPGKGTTFVLRLPFTLAVTQAILVRIGETSYAIPMTSVQGVARIRPDDLAARMASGEPGFEYNGENYGIHDLVELLGLSTSHVVEDEQIPLLLTRSGDLRAAIRVDAVIGSREIVVKSVGPQISSVPGVLGATIMGDGSVLVILDLAPLVRHGEARREQRQAEGLVVAPAAVEELQRVRPLVMVVDDSITMRKVTGRVLERHEYEVSTAKDGLDALEKLHEQRVPDLMLLDIEMPRMDGYELATQMKADPRLRGVPIIMITSRTGEKHRQRAFDIGVDRYLGKPYQEAELLAQIGEVLEQRATEPAHG